VDDLCGSRSRLLPVLQVCPDDAPRCADHPEADIVQIHGNLLYELTFIRDRRCGNIRMRSEKTIVIAAAPADSAAMKVKGNARDKDQRGP